MSTEREPVENVVGRVRSSFDSSASFYAQHRGPISPSLRRAARMMLADLGPAAHVLDLGSGPGRDSRWLRDRGADVISVDNSRGMLDVGVATGNILVPVFADLRSLPIATASADGVWSVAAMHHLPRSQASAVLSEMRRVLRQDGRLFLSVRFGQGEGFEPYRLDPSQQMYFTRYGVEELRGLARTAGFGVIGTGVTGKRALPWLDLSARAL